MSTRERPIIFSGPMATAILRGEKTQTRRVMKPQPSSVDEHGRWYRMPYGGEALMNQWPCPFGQPGDRLWVRESFSSDWILHQLPPREWPHGAPVHYWADGNPEYGDWTPPKPPIHMPRWASRLTLEIVSVRVERLQAITEDDTDAEVFGGDYPHTVRPDLFPDFEAAGALSMQECFARVWDDINGKKPGRAWADNPWTWVIEFEQVTP